MAKVNIASQKIICSLNGTVINVRSLEGGSATADVVQDAGSNFIGTKHVSNIHYEDFVFETGLSDEVTRVIKSTWNDGNFYSDGVFTTASSDLKTTLYEDEFSGALLTETTIPQCDAASKDAAVFRLRLKPERVQDKMGSVNSTVLKTSLKTKAMLKSNFRFELGKLPCARVSAIDSFSVKLFINEDMIGTRNQPTKSTTINFPNLFITISSTDLAPWFDYYKSSLIDGHHLQSDKIDGRLVFLAPDFRSELFVINLQGVGIFSLQRNLGLTNNISRFRVGLYCDRMEIG